MSRFLKLALAAIVGSVLVVGGIWFFVPRETKLCPTCLGTGAQSCGAPGCVNGRGPCSGSCLKREDPNWRVTTNPHFGPNTLTLVFYNDDGSYGEVSQQHVGQTMTKANGVWSLGPNCTLCGGTTRVACPSCGSKQRCPICRGKGEIPK